MTLFFVFMIAMVVMFVVGVVFSQKNQDKIDAAKRLADRLRNIMHD